MVSSVLGMTRSGLSSMTLYMVSACNTLILSLLLYVSMSLSSPVLHSSMSSS